MNKKVLYAVRAYQLVGNWVMFECCAKLSYQENISLFIRSWVWGI